MRHVLGMLALLFALGGCGDDTSAGSPPPESSPDVTLVHATAGGGDVETQATDVTDESDLASYVGQFDDAFAAKVTQAAQGLDGDVVLAQVVAVGCDVPPSAHVQDDVIVPEDVASPMKECFAPVTTVGLAAVSD